MQLLKPPCFNAGQTNKITNIRKKDKSTIVKTTKHDFTQSNQEVKNLKIMYDLMGGSEYVEDNIILTFKDDICIINLAGPIYEFLSEKLLTIIYNYKKVKIRGWLENNFTFNIKKEVKIIDASELDVSRMTNMSYMFTNCYRLESLDISNFDTSNVTDMSYMFAHCNKLKSLDLSNFNTACVTNMRAMFIECYSLISLNLLNFNTACVTNMSSMFKNCIALTSLNASSFNTSQVTNMSSMFYNCNLNYLDILNFNTSNVTKGGII